MSRANKPRFLGHRLRLRERFVNYGLVLANHPRRTPSEHDKLLTRAIVLAADTVQLKIVDPLIVSADETFSFRRAGLL